MKRFLQRLLRRTSGLRLHALAALFFLGYFASFAHDVSVRHTLCVEHGEWVDDASSTAEVGSAPASEDGSPQIRSVPRAAQDPHEHCAIVLVTRGARWLAANAPTAIHAPVLDRPCDEVVCARAVSEVWIRSTPARGPPASA